MMNDEQIGAMEAKLRAIAKASRYQFPTADIDVMLREMDSGRDIRGLQCIEFRPSEESKQ